MRLDFWGGFITWYSQRLHSLLLCNFHISLLLTSLCVSVCTNKAFQYINLLFQRFPKRFRHYSLRTGAHVRNLSDAVRTQAATITSTLLLLCLSKHRFWYKLASCMLQKNLRRVYGTNIYRNLSKMNILYMEQYAFHTLFYC